MAKHLLNETVVFYIIIAFCSAGLLLRLLLNMIYLCLIRASKHMANSKNSLMKLVRLKFEACYQLKQTVHNVDIFVDKYIFQYKFCGIFLYTWENIGVQLLVLCLLSSVILVGVEFLSACANSLILFTFFMGVFSSALLIILEGFLNFPAKKQLVRINMKDYLENHLQAKLEQIYFHPQERKAYQNSYFEESSLPQQKEQAHKKKNRRFTEDGEEVIEEVLREFVI